MQQVADACITHVKNYFLEANLYIYPHMYSNISDHELNCAVMMWTQLKHRHLCHAAKSVPLPDECITTTLWSINIDMEDGSERARF